MEKNMQKIETNEEEDQLSRLRRVCPEVWDCSDEFWDESMGSVAYFDSDRKKRRKGKRPRIK